MDFHFKAAVAKESAIVPDAMIALGAIPETYPLFHEKRESRHPFALYNTSLWNVGLRLRRVLETLLDQKGIVDYLTTNAPQWHTEMIERYDAFLDALMEHTEDCENVLRCLFENESLYKISTQVRNYLGATRKYRKHIGLVVNRIKHNQGRVRLVFLAQDAALIPGYYVEGLDGNGTVGPSIWVHKDGATAFSFHRDLRYHICGVFGISTNLSECVRTIVGMKDMPTQESQHKKRDDLSHGIELLAQTPATVFPDEVAKPWPEVTISQDEASAVRQVTIRFPSPVSKATFPYTSFEVRTGLHVDGRSRDFRLPYLKSEKGFTTKNVTVWKGK
jgi:hypothetical protein